MSDEDVDLDAEELQGATEVVSCYESLRTAMGEAADKMDALNKKASTELVNEVESIANEAEYVSDDLRNALDSY